jgi:hypothetical protein
MNICTFCLKSPNDPTPWCKDNPGHGCTYGLHHEFPEEAEKAKPVQPKKDPKKALCTKCGLHPKNPVFNTNGCEHEFSA